MIGAGVEIRVEGGTALAQRLKAVASKLNAPADLYTEIGDALVVSTQHRFETGRGPGGGLGSIWPISIRALFEGGQTLKDSGRLKNSITREADDTGVAVGTNVIYAAVHQFGATIRPKTSDKLYFTVLGKKVAAKQVKIPARPFLGLDAADEAEIAQISEDFLAAGLGVSNA